MYCKQIAKQTGGEITEIRLDDGPYCSMADICRRKGICALSPHSCPGVVNGQEKHEAAYSRDFLSDGTGAACYEVLIFKNSLGFQWQRVESFAEAINFFGSRRQEGAPRLIRRVDYIRLP